MSTTMTIAAKTSKMSAGDVARSISDKVRLQKRCQGML
jgi:hypothetical protein